MTSKWRDASGKRIWTAADAARERGRRRNPADMRRSRARRSGTDWLNPQRAVAQRMALYAAAVERATGELADLIAAQAADARCYRMRSVSIEVAEWGSGSEWDDPTADAALERMAA